MQVYDINSFDLKNTAVALGHFDSIHKGHIKIIKKTVDYAKENGLISVVYLFANEPLNIVLNANFKPLCTLKKRIELLETLGVDAVVTQEFDKTFMNIECRKFVELYLKEKLDAKAVFTGFNYHFGKNAEGDTEALKKICFSFNISVDVIEEEKVDGISVSTTQIKKFVENGDMENTEKFLGRAYSLCGVVEHGNRIGTNILKLPTANIQIPKDIIMPKYGVYISDVLIEGKSFNSLTNIGAKPTFNDNHKVIETHIFGEVQSIYGKKIEILFRKYMRDIKKFKNAYDLSEQLKKDIYAAEIYFNNKNEVLL